MRIAVKDANVFIDLIEADLLGLWFGLGIETHTTDLVLHEINEPGQRSAIDQFVSANLIVVHSLTGVDVGEAGALSLQWKMSTADASVVLLAKHLNSPLLSGDAAVRKAARSLTIEVYGVLWILDRLVDQKKLTPQEAKQRLTAMREGGSFLPPAECEARLRRWSGA